MRNILIVYRLTPKNDHIQSNTEDESIQPPVAKKLKTSVLDLVSPERQKELNAQASTKGAVLIIAEGIAEE